LSSRAATLAKVWAASSWRWKTYVEKYSLINGNKMLLASKALCYKTERQSETDFLMGKKRN